MPVFLCVSLFPLVPRNKIFNASWQIVLLFVFSESKVKTLRIAFQSNLILFRQEGWGEGIGPFRLWKVITFLITFKITPANSFGLSVALLCSNMQLKERSKQKSSRCGNAGRLRQYCFVMFQSPKRVLSVIRL